MRLLRAAKVLLISLGIAVGGFLAIEDAARHLGHFRPCSRAESCVSEFASHDITQPVLHILEGMIAGALIGTLLSLPLVVVAGFVSRL
jgi:hypothetical protein